MEAYIFSLQKDGEVIDFNSGDQEAEIFSFGTSDTFLVAIKGVPPKQNSELFYEELSFDQFSAQINENATKTEQDKELKKRLETTKTY